MNFCSSILFKRKKLCHPLWKESDILMIINCQKKNLSIKFSKKLLNKTDSLKSASKNLLKTKNLFSNTPQLLISSSMNYVSILMAFTRNSFKKTQNILLWLDSKTSFKNNNFLSKTNQNYKRIFCSFNLILPPSMPWLANYGKEQILNIFL